MARSGARRRATISVRTRRGELRKSWLMLQSRLVPSGAPSATWASIARLENGSCRSAALVLPPSILERAMGAAQNVDGVFIPEITVGTGYWTSCRALERSCCTEELLVQSPLPGQAPLHDGYRRLRDISLGHGGRRAQVEDARGRPHADVDSRLDRARRRSDDTGRGPLQALLLRAGAGVVQAGPSRERSPARPRRRSGHTAGTGAGWRPNRALRWERSSSGGWRLVRTDWVPSWELDGQRADLRRSNPLSALC